jgi:O-antigen ligase
MIICVCSGLVATLGFFELIFAFNPLYKYFIENPFYERYITDWVRPMSTLFNPAPLASYLLVTLPSAIYIFKSKTRIKKTCGAIVLIINLVCFILTFSRGSFLGLLAMLFFFLLIQRKYKKTLLLIFILLFFSLLMSILPYPFSRLSPKGIGIYGTGIFSDYRITRAKMVVNMLKTNPLSGVGLNNFRVLFDKYYPRQSELPYVDYEIKIPDNMHLTLLAETGILGLSGFLIFIFMLLKEAIKKIRRTQNPVSNPVSLYPALSLIGLLFSMAGYELFYWHTPYMLFCLICGFMQSQESSLRRNI